SVGTFGAHAAMDAASRLESMGRGKDLSGAGPILAELEKDVDNLRTQLERILLAHRASGAWQGDQCMSTGEAPIA
ncbi:MAG: hypothetical protein ABI742_13715, partial [Gemmatimonadota bacterium]